MDAREMTLSNRGTGSSPWPRLTAFKGVHLRELRIPDKELQAIKALNRHGVEYLLIGGYAMRFYGADRTPEDIDLFAKNSRENACRLYAAISEIVGHHPIFTERDLEEPGKRISLRSSSEGD